MRTARVFFLDYILVTVPEVQCVYMSLPYMCDIKVVPRIQPGCAWDQNDRYLCLAARETIIETCHEKIPLHRWYHPVGTTRQIAHISNQNTSFLIKENGIHRPNNASQASSEFYLKSTYRCPTIQRFTRALHRWKEFSKTIDPAHRDVFNKSSLIFIIRYHSCTPLNCPTQDYLRKSNVQASWDGL